MISLSVEEHVENLHKQIFMTAHLVNILARASVWSIGTKQHLKRTCGRKIIESKRIARTDIYVHILDCSQIPLNV